METERFQPNPPYLTTLRLGVTVVALLILAGSVLLLWLIDDQDAGLIIALAAILVGWVVALILAKPLPESPTQIINPDDDSSPSLSPY